MSNSVSSMLPIEPVRPCCGKRHMTVMCPDGLTMCCICFNRVVLADLTTDPDGCKVDVCMECTRDEAEYINRFDIERCKMAIRASIRGTKNHLKQTYEAIGIVPLITSIDPVLLPDNTPVEVISAWIRLHDQGVKDIKTIESWLGND